MSGSSKLVVVAFARGAWSWLRVESELTLGQGAEAVTRPASSVTYELQDQPGRATTWDAAKSAEATNAARLVGGTVVPSTWRPERIEARIA